MIKIGPLLHGARQVKLLGIMARLIRYIGKFFAAFYRRGSTLSAISIDMSTIHHDNIGVLQERVRQVKLFQLLLCAIRQYFIGHVRFDSSTLDEF
jgi:hypothetical protein